MRNFYMHRDDKLKLSRAQGKHLDEWVINDIIGEGGSCVCYSARCGATFGRLKEFYPIDISFTRNEENQLVPRTKQRYEQLRYDFLDTFEILNSARNRPEFEGQLLNNFLPVQELLYGEQGAVYIWSPNDRLGITLNDYLKKTPLDKRNLQEILQLTMSLADFLRAIHTLGFLHLDIKPSNILVTVNAQGLLNPNSITVFDFDSVYNLKDDKPPRRLGTSGFSAPELKTGSVISNKVDIFSLGALMFSALFGKPFTAENYPLLGQLVDRSPVSCDIGVDNQRRLTSILQQALAHYPDFRYRSVTLLSRDLQTLTKQCRLNVTSAAPHGNLKIAVQNLLYKSPLFTPENKRIHVVIVGAGNVAQKFIDQALQCAQVPAHSIHIRAFSLEPEKDCKNYLSSRPALKDFVRVNGELRCGECFGKLDFLPLPTIEGIEGMSFCLNLEVDGRIATKILDKCTEVNYVFIATGDDELNHSVAKTFATLTNCPVKFLTPEDFLVNETLEKMAFNTHLSWLGHLNGIDMADVKADFLKRYNHESSLDFALSIQYKLAALGIELEDFDKAAREFTEKLDDKILAVLSKAEHSRWLIEKACGGWQVPKTPSGAIDYAHCVACLRSNDKPQDDSRLLHHCLIPFDDLDRMSNELHEAVVNEATMIKRGAAWRHHLAELMAVFQDGDEKTLTSFKTFMLSLQEILRGNVFHSRNVKSRFKELKAVINHLPESTKTVAQEHCDFLRKVFLVLAEANIFRDYKANDFILVRKIPFILSFKPPKIIMAFDDDRADSAELFGNVATATVLNPTELTYLYFADTRSNSKLLAKRLHAALDFLVKRKIRADVTLVVAVLKGTDFDAVPLHEMSLKSLTVYEVANMEHAENFFLECIENSGALFDGSTKLFQSPFVQSEFIGHLAQKFPYFEFDYLSKKFFWTRRCQFLNYVEDNSFLSVRDLFAFYNNKVRAANVLNSESDYCRRLCELLKSDFDKCRRLIAVLSKHEENRTHLTLNFEPANAETMPLQFFLPAAVKTKVDFLLNQLMATNIVTDVNIIDSDDTLSVTFRSLPINDERFGKILAALSTDCDIDLQAVDAAVKVSLTSLATTLALPADCLPILRRFSENRLLLNLKTDTKRVRFRYASPAIKKLLTSFKNALKTFLSLTAWLSGRFDDMACDVEFLWSGTKQRFDFVAMKGFSCLVLQIIQGSDKSGLYEFAVQSGSVVGMRSKKICLFVDGQPDNEILATANQLGVTTLHREGEILNFLNFV